MIDIPVLVKEALKKGTYKKKYKIKVLNNWGTVSFTIDNDNLVSESVKIDERLCSETTLKFGLCEGSSLEFQYFGKSNIKGKDLKLILSVWYNNQGSWEWYDIPMGFFTVDTVSRQASTGIYHVTAYNKLKSKYFDKKANELLIEQLSDPERSLTLYDVTDILLSDYRIEPKKEWSQQVFPSTGGSPRKLSGGSLNLVSKYGADTPFSFYEYRGADTSGSVAGYPFVEAEEDVVVLSRGDYYRIDFGDYDLDSLELYYYNAIQVLAIDSFADSDGFMQRLFTPQTSSGTSYSSFLGWHQFFGIALEKWDNTVEWYSTIAYEAGLTGVVGTFSDLAKRTIIGDEYNSITICTPKKLYFSSSASVPYNPPNYLEYKFFCNQGHPPNNAYEYTYYTDSGLSNTATGEYTWTDDRGNYIVQSEVGTYWNATKEIMLSDVEKVIVIPATMPDFTLRELQSAIYETECKFGKLDRETDLFSGVRLNNSRLYPVEGLYPATNLYPGGAVLSTFKSIYSKLWADEDNVQTFRYLIITYKTLDENNNEIDAVLQRTVNNRGTQDYVCSDNWALRNIVWTQQQIATIASRMVSVLRYLEWFPFEMWCAGLPFLETGDEIEVTIGEETYTTYTLQRSLKGIQNLEDTFVNGELDIF